MTVTSHLTLLLKNKIIEKIRWKKNALSLGDFNLTYLCLFRTVGSLATLEMHSAVVMLMNGDLS